MNKTKIMKKYLVFGLILVMFGLFTACGSINSNSNSSDSDSSSAQESVIENREGFSIREISDDLFDRMKTGNTYKRKFLSDR